MKPSPVRGARGFFAAALIALAAVPWCASAAPVAYGDLLEQANELRSADPAAFQEKLAELTRRTGEATPSQREHLEYLKAYGLAYTGRYDMAIGQASTLFDTTQDDALKFRAGLLIANSYAATREFGSGLAYLERSLELMDDVHDPQLRNDGMTVAAVLYNQVGQYELGVDYAERILAASPSERSRCFAGYLRLEAMRELKTLVDPPAAVGELIEHCLAQGEVVAANLARSQLSRMLAESGDLAGATRLLTDNLDEIEATRYPRLIGEIHSVLAGHLLAANDLPGAERHARRAIEASAPTTFPLPVVAAQRTLYEVALRRGDLASALAHYRDYAAADKAYLDDVQAKQLAYQMVRHETLQKSHQIELLNQRNAVLQLEQKVAAQATRNTQLLVVLLAVVAGSIGFWAWRTKQSQVSFRRLAQTDALTGIANRLHFTRKAEEALAYCRKSGQDVGLVMFDLDEFKGINDRYGHAAGDYVLKAVAEACSQACRKGDLIGRLGGEEFALLLVGCDLAASVSIAQQCRERIARIETSVTGDHFRVTASFGVAGSREGGHDFLTLLRRADDALYRAKREGRDRVIVDGREDVAPATA